MRAWFADALCLDEDPELFFPSGEGKLSQPQIESAQSICRMCPVRSNCLRLALTTDSQYGVWGGTTPKERDRLRRRAGIERVKRRHVVGRMRLAVSANLPEAPVMRMVEGQ